MFIWLSSCLLIETRSESDAAHNEFQRPFDSNHLCRRYGLALYLVYVVRWANLNVRRKLTDNTVWNRNYLGTSGPRAQGLEKIAKVVGVEANAQLRELERELDHREHG